MTRQFHKNDLYIRFEIWKRDFDYKLVSLRSLNRQFCKSEQFQKDFRHIENKTSRLYAIAEGEFTFFSRKIKNSLFNIIPQPRNPADGSVLKDRFSL